MKVNRTGIELETDDLKELFSLFCSPAHDELETIYDSSSVHYFENVDLQDEYTLSQESREFSRDAWRSVIYFLRSKGFELIHENKPIDLSFVENEFV